MVGQLEQVRRLRERRASRDAGAAAGALERLATAAGTEENLVPPLVACARTGCTEGEIVDALRRVFGGYMETPRF